MDADFVEFKRKEWTDALAKLEQQIPLLMAQRDQLRGALFALQEISKPVQTVTPEQLAKAEVVP